MVDLTALAIHDGAAERREKKRRGGKKVRGDDGR